MKGSKFSRGAVRQAKPRGCEDHPLDYKDIEHLRLFLTPQGQIQGRRRTGFCAQCQRDLKHAVKRARHLALLAFVG